MGAARPAQTPEGVHEIHAVLASTRRYSAQPATGVAASWPPRRPWAVVVLEGAAASARREALPVGSADVGPPRDGAPDGLRHLSSTHAVVMLTRRSERSRAEIRIWLKEHKFPNIPVIFLPAEPGTGDDSSADLKDWLKTRGRKDGCCRSGSPSKRRTSKRSWTPACAPSGSARAAGFPRKPAASRRGRTSEKRFRSVVPAREVCGIGLIYDGFLIYFIKLTVCPAFQTAKMRNPPWRQENGSRFKTG